MASLAELVKGFRANVRAGIPTTLQYEGKHIYLNITHPNDAASQKGYVGIATAPDHETAILFTAQQNEHITREAKLQADVTIMEALQEITSIYVCFNDADQNLIKALRHTKERINRPYIPRVYPPNDSELTQTNL